MTPPVPPLAGLASLESAAAPGLGVQPSVDRLKRLHYALLRSWQACLARLTAEPLYEVKMGLAYHAHLAAENCAAARDRVAEMRHPPLGLDLIPHPALATFFDEIQAAPSTHAFLSGLYHIALPALRDAAEKQVRDSNPLAESPTIRILNAAILDLEAMIDWGQNAAAALAESQEIAAEEHDSQIRWLVDLDRWLAAAGGLDGTSPPSGHTPDPKFSASPFIYDKSPRRDERFPDPYNMGVHAEEFLYDPQFADKDKVLMMFYKRLREIDVPEMMASILFEMSQSSPDEESGGTPWKFYQDMTRQLWDEARHAMMGEVGFTNLGIDWPKHVMVNFTWSKCLNEQLTPRERHAVLWFIEQGLMSKTGKRYEWEVGRDSGNHLAELFQDYDWADEVLHARIGRDWFVKDFPDVKAAADFGSACWDKVVSDWETWKKEGLTEHRNWWPDLYRAACAARGETPDPATLAFSTSYASTRADLKRISTSA